MADKNFKARIVNKNGTSAEWEKATSFVPKKGELILYTDLNKIKIGDGVTVVGDLPFSDDDKVSRAGDTITGFLQFNAENEGYRGGGVVFGPEFDEAKPLIPYILGASNDDNGHMDIVAPEVNIHNITLVGKFNGNAITLQHIADGEAFNDAVTVGQLNTRVNKTGDTMSGDLKMADDSGAVKGSLSDITDGVALSAEDGACLKVGAEAVTVCDNAGGTSQIKGVKAPVDDTDAANKKYVDDSIPTAQIEKLSSAVAKAEPFFVEVTIVPDGNHTINKTFSEIKAAYDAGRICYLRTTNQGGLAQLIGITGLDTSREAMFVCVDPSNLELTTGAFIVAEEDNSVTITIFKSQRIIEATGLLKGSGNGTVTAAVAGTDYAAVDHTHDTYTATEIDAMWNAVTIS